MNENIATGAVTISDGRGNTFNLCRPCLVAAIAELDGAP